MPADGNLAVCAHHAANVRLSCVAPLEEDTTHKLEVHVRVGGTTWDTSIFPDSKSGTYVLPVKRLVRDREGLSEGDDMEVHLEVVPT